MTKSVTPQSDGLPPGVEDQKAVWGDGADHAETLAALEEYRRTGESISVEEAMAELEQLIAERRAQKP